MRPWVCALALFVAATALSVGADAQPRREPAPSGRYRAALDAYRSGRFEEALKALREMDNREISDSVDALIATSLKPFRVDVLQGAFVMHLDASLSPLPPPAADSQPATPTALHTKLVGTLLVVDLIGNSPADEFQRIYFCFTVARAQLMGNLPGALTSWRAAPQVIREHPEMQLALGSMHEMGWTWKHEGDLDVGRRWMGADRFAAVPNLSSAADAYRRAMNGAPSLAEARVRLARVLILDNKMDEGRALLAGIGPGTEAGFLYLARLFDGDAAERAGRLDEAQQAYIAAQQVLPEAQSAAIALAHLRHLRGERADAARRTQQFATHAATADAGDPWEWYGRGVGWRAPGYFEMLQEIVTRK